MTNVPGTTDGCLDAETLAALIDGRLTPEARARAQQHAATCPDCYEVFRDVVNTWPTPTTASTGTSAGASRPWHRYGWIGGGLAAAATIALTIMLPRSGNTPTSRTPGLDELVAAVGTTRTVEGRLSGGFAWGPPDALRSGPNTRRLAPPIESAAAALEGALDADRSAASLSAFATSRLILGEVDRAIDPLEEATALEPGRAAYWSDLALARLGQSAQAGNEATRVAALQAVEEALALEPRMPEALFNRALILERLGRLDQARQAWLTYLAVPDEAAWQDEGRERLARLEAAIASPQSRGPDAEPLRQQLWGPLLRAWVDAGHDAARSQEALSALRAKGTEIAALVDDRMVTDFLASLTRVESDTSLLPKALSAHSAYLQLQSAIARQEPQAARLALETARPGLAALGSPLELTAQFNEASLSFRREDTALTHDRFVRVRDAAAARDYVWLVARSEWMLGLTLALIGNYRESTRQYESALDGFAQVADAPNRAAALALLATNYDNLGDPWRGWTYRLESIAQAPRANVLLSAALSAADREWSRAALVFADEALTVARAAGTVANAADALRTKAMLHARIGDTSTAGALLAEARALAANQTDASWDRVRAEIDLAEAQSAGPDRIAQGIHAATAAIDYFSRAGAPLRLPELLSVRASLLRRAGRTDDARLDVERGLAALEAQYPTVPTGRDQVTFETTERGLLAQLLSLTVDAAAATDAVFLRVDASRGRDLPSGRPPASLAALAAGLPADTTLAVFMIGDDESFVWLVTRGQHHLDRIPAGRRALADLVQRALPPRHDEVAIQQLATLLVEPIARHRPSDSRWMLVPDGPIAAVPFALLPTEDGAPLAARRTIAVTPSVSVWLGSAPRRSPSTTTSASRLLAVGNPTLNPSEYPGLGDLPEAGRETDAVAAVYTRNASVLRGPSATRQALLTELPRATVAHIAAHAVANPWVSDASYVALAGPEPSRLTASDVRGLRLPLAPVVVLAACETAVGGHPARTAALSLSRAFLAAGASSVVGSLWRVSDRATRALSMELHAQYVRTGDIALSLRRAQLVMAASPDPLLASPRQWGAFVVMSGPPH